MTENSSGTLEHRASQRVLLASVYALRLDPKLYQAMEPYPPLATLYAVGALRQHGCDVSFFDSTLTESEGEFSESLVRTRPEVVVLYEDYFNYLTKMCLAAARREACSMIERARAFGATVVVASPDASDYPDVYLDSGANFVIVGEGEITLVEIVDAIARDTAEEEEIAGVASVPGRAIRSRPPISDLDGIPKPAWDVVDMERYRRVWCDRHGHFSLNLVSTRGCPYHCNWCAKPIWGQRYHSRTPHDVVSEMRSLNDRYSPDYIWFMDDIFGLRRGWLAEFAEQLEASKLRIPFKCLSRPDLLLREGEVEALARAGCDSVWMGAESGSQRILDAMEKGTKVEQVRQAAKNLEREGIRVGLFLQFGYPGETRVDIDKTLALVREVSPDDIGVSVSYPLPGTKFYQRVQSQLGTKTRWDDSADLAMMYRGPFPTAFYRQLHHLLHLEFRARRSMLELERGIRRPGSLRIRHFKDAVRGALGWLSIPLERSRLNRLAHPLVDPTGLPSPELGPLEASRPSSQCSEEIG